MNKYLVTYYDRSPLDPKDRFKIHRETVTANNIREAYEIMVNAGKEVIDITGAKS